MQGEVFLFQERFSLLVGELFASVFQGDMLACLTKWFFRLPGEKMFGSVCREEFSSPWRSHFFA